MKKSIIQPIAIFCICLIINTTFVYAATISHNSATDVSIEGNEATINWTTDEPGDSRVNYGNSTNLTKTEYAVGLKTNHSITLDHLDYLTTYYYELVSENSSGGITADNNSDSYYQFTTPAIIPSNYSLNDTTVVVGTEDTTAPFLVADLPSLVNRMYIDFRASTEPDSFIYLYVNPLPGQETTPSYNRFTTSDDNGNFSFRAVSLTQESNLIALRIVDNASNQAIYYFNVRVDSTPPTVYISPDPLPGFVNTTSFNVNGTVDENVTVTYTVNNITSSIETDSDFSFSINLEHNRTNEVYISVFDGAGNGREIRQNIYVDAEAPTILFHNIDELSPSYIQEVTIRGRVSEPNATVIIFVNNQTSVYSSWTTSVMDNIKKFGRVVMGDTDYITTTDSEGYFEVDVLLAIDLQKESTEPFYPDQLNNSYGEDAYYMGRTIRTTGSDYEPEYEWDNDIKILVIDRVGLTGEDNGVITFAKCGYGSDWNIKIGDASPGVVTPEHLRLGIAQFGFRVDLEWHGAGDEKDVTMTENPIVRTYELSQDRRNQYIIDPNELVGRSGPISQWSDDKKTGYVLVQLNTFNYSQPELSDIKLKNLTLHIPMMIEMHYDYPWFGRTATGVQKQCWDVNLLLDIQVPPDTIPKWLLNASIFLINNTIFLIDKILVPLRKISVIVFITCLSSWLILFAQTTREKMSCFGLDKDGFGYCTEEQKNNEPDRCMECESAVESTNKVESLMHWVCDRMFCPSVPSVTKFMQTHKVKECKDKSIIDYKQFKNTQDVKTNPSADNCIKDYAQQWEAGCALEDEFKLSKCLELNDVEACGGAFKQFINKVAGFCEKEPDSGERYVNYKDQTFVRTRDDSGNLKWCMGEQVERGELESGTGKIKTKEELIKETVAGGECDFRVHGSSNEVYKPRNFGDGPVLNKDNANDGRYPIGTGTDKTEIKYNNLNSGAINEPVSPYGKDAVVGESGQVYIYREGTERWEAVDPTDKSYYGEWEPFKDDYYDQNTGKTYGEISDDADRKKEFQRVRAPEEVEDELVTARNYILKPASSIIRAVQCVCIPAVTGYLTLWRNVLQQVMLCFQSVMVTGNPNTGLCRAVLTVYVCDLIFDAIRCFMNKYSSVETGETNANSIGGFMKSVASAGKDVQEGIVGRYGETSLYNSMFNERKVIHQVCLAAFTGDWDIDLEGMLAGAGAIPIKSEGFLYPHTRRFMTSNPLNGRATYIYHLGVGLVAGADLSYNLALVCSNDMSCDPGDNFLNGQCDCFKRGQEEVFPVTSFVGFGTSGSGAGRLEAGQMIGPNDGDIYIPAYDSAVRYDKVRLTWTYVNNERQTVTEVVEKPIRLIGGKPPAECKFDIGSLEFRCGIAIGDKGHAAFSEWPKPEKDFYYIGDTIRIKFRVDKKSPNYDATSTNPEVSNSENQIPKWLCWEVSKSGGRVKDAQCTELRQDGSYTEENFPQIPGVTIEMSDISGAGGSSGNCLQYGGTDFANNFFCGGSTITAAYKITHEGEGKYSYLEGKYSTAGGFEPTTGKGDCTKTDKKVKCGEFSFDVNSDPAVGKWFVMKYERSGTGGETQCNDATESNPQIWKIKMWLLNPTAQNEDEEISARNAVKNPSDIATYAGKKQEADVEVKVVCAESSEQSKRKCSGNGYYESTDCWCYKDNDEGSESNRLCSGGNMYCYNYGGEVENCYSGDCADSSTANTAPCDCDGNKQINKNECVGMYCVNDEIREDGSLESKDVAREDKGEKSLIDRNYCSELPIGKLREALG